jgi:hypothetical protein
VNKEFPPEVSSHLTKVKQIILQDYLDGKMLYTNGVLWSINHLQPPEGWEPKDLILIGGFCAECMMEKANVIPNAKKLAMEHNLNIVY